MIRWAAAGDAQALAPILRALHTHDVLDAAHLSDADFLDHAARLTSDAASHRLLLAWDGDAVVGLAALGLFLSISDPRPERRVQVELKELFAMPAQRGAGVGARLLEVAEEWARAAGASRIDWHVKAGNTAGIAFYERWGGRMLDGRKSIRKAL